MLGSISTGTDTDEENDKIVVFELRMVKKIFALKLNGGGAVTTGVLNPCFNPRLAGLQQRLDKPV